MAGKRTIAREAVQKKARPSKVHWAMTGSKRLRAKKPDLVLSGRDTQSTRGKK